MSVAARRVLLPERCSIFPVSAGASIRRIGGATMGTSWRVALVDPGGLLDIGMLRRRIETLFAAIVGAMSTWDEDSEISRFNRAPAGSVHVLSPGFSAVLEAALRIAEETGGFFDPTVGPAVSACGFGPPNTARSESDSWVSRWREIALEPRSGAVRQPGGVGLDLSAIAKGYAVDRLADLLRDAGIPSFLAEIGGELVGRGTKPGGAPWWVLLETPPGDARRIVPTVVALQGLAVAGSGDYRRRADADGHVVSHLIDPRTGRPASGEVAAVSVVHESCMHADALATALAVMNADGAIAFAEQRGIAARIVLRRGDALEDHLSGAMLRMAE